jgi:hypothetical protein
MEREFRRVRSEAVGVKVARCRWLCCSRCRTRSVGVHGYERFVTFQGACIKDNAIWCHSRSSSLVLAHSEVDERITIDRGSSSVKMMRDAGNDAKWEHYEDQES